MSEAESGRCIPTDAVGLAPERDERRSMPASSVYGTRAAARPPPESR